MRDALQFANDVGILQYYPGIDRDIVFTDPLFLVQAFGVVIYDKEPFNHYITGREGCAFQRAELRHVYICALGNLACSKGRGRRKKKGPSACLKSRLLKLL